MISTCIWSICLRQAAISWVEIFFSHWKTRYYLQVIISHQIDTMKHNGLTLFCSWRWTTAAADLPRPVSFFRLRRDLFVFHCSGHYPLLFFWLICFYFSSFVGHNSMWIPKAQIFFHSTLLWCIFSRIEISTFSMHRVRVSFLFCSSVLLLFCFQVLFLAVFSFTIM